MDQVAALRLKKSMLLQLMHNVTSVIAMRQIVIPQNAAKRLLIAHSQVHQPAQWQQKQNLLLLATGLHAALARSKKIVLTIFSSDIIETHISLFDGTNEGIKHKTLPVYSVQYHPEASPGPHDSRYLFDEFVKTMNSYKN